MGDATAKELLYGEKDHVYVEDRSKTMVGHIAWDALKPKLWVWLRG